MRENFIRLKNTIKTNIKKRNISNLLIGISGIIFLLAIFLRLYQLGVKGLWLDEVFTFMRANYPISEILAGKTRQGPSFNHPPFYFLLAHFMFDMSPTDFALRVPAMIAGILSVPVIGLLGINLFKKQDGILVALLLTLSPVAIHYSQEARSYSMLALFSLLSALALYKTIESSSPWWWVGLLLANAFGLFTSYLHLLFIAAQAIFLMLWLMTKLSSEGQKVLFYFVMTLVALILFSSIANLSVLDSVISFDSSSDGAINNQNLIKALPVLKEAFYWIHLYDNWIIEYFFVFMFVVGLIKHLFEREINSILLLLLYILLPISLVIISNPPNTDIYPRYFIIVLPFYLLLVGRGLVVFHEFLLALFLRFIKAPKIRVEMLIWVALVSFILFPHYSALNSYYEGVPGYFRHKPEWKEVVSYLEQNWQPGQLILTANPNTHLTFSRYMPVWNIESNESLKSVIDQGHAGFLIVDDWSSRKPFSPKNIKNFAVEEIRFPQVILYSFNAPNTLSQEAIVLNLGSKEREMFIGEGWWPIFHEEDQQSYGRTIGNVSSFEVILQHQSYNMNFTSKTMVGSQSLIVQINGEPINQDLTIEPDWATYEVPLPANLINQGLNRIELKYQPLDSKAAESSFIGETGVKAPLAIAVEAKGKEKGNDAVIYLDGVPYSYYVAGRGYGRGYTVLALSQEGELLEWEAFDTCCPESSNDESHRLSEFIKQQPSGTIIMMATKGDASNSLTEEAIQAIRSVGAEVDLRGKFKWMHALIGVKGAEPGTAIEVLAQDEATIAIGGDGKKNILLFDKIELLKK